MIGRGPEENDGGYNPWGAPPEPRQFTSQTEAWFEFMGRPDFQNAYGTFEEFLLAVAPELLNEDSETTSE